jgi:hypothetical protein
MGGSATGASFGRNMVTPRLTKVREICETGARAACRRDDRDEQSTEHASHLPWAQPKRPRCRVRTEPAIARRGSNRPSVPNGNATAGYVTPSGRATIAARRRRCATGRRGDAEHVAAHDDDPPRNVRRARQRSGRTRPNVGHETNRVTARETLQVSQIPPRARPRAQRSFLAPARTGRDVNMDRGFPN